MRARAGRNTGIFGEAYVFNVGGAYRGFPADAICQKVGTSRRPRRRGDHMRAVISDNEFWSVQGKYTDEFCDGLKDGAASARPTF